MKEMFKRSGLFFISLFMLVLSYSTGLYVQNKNKYTYCGVIIDKYERPFSKRKSTHIYYEKFYVLKNSNTYREVQLDSYYNLNDKICVELYDDGILFKVCIAVFFLFCFICFFGFLIMVLG